MNASMSRPFPLAPSSAQTTSFFCSSFSHITQVFCSSSPGSGFSPTHLQEEEKPFARDLGFTFVYRSHICFFPAICVLFYLFILDRGMQKHLDQDKVPKKKPKEKTSVDSKIIVL